MKKCRLYMALFFSIGLCLSGCEKKERTADTATNLSTSQSFFIESSEPIDTKESSENSQPTQQEIDDFLDDFGKRWVNYSSVDERNESVRSFMTEECAKANGLLVQTNADYESTGQITDCYRSMTLENHYLVWGMEESKGGRNPLVLVVELSPSTTPLLIESFTVHYVRQAY